MKAQIVSACVAALAFSCFGADLVVAADGVEPVKVRYLFQKPWVGGLYAKSGLPIGPFEASR